MSNTAGKGAVLPHNVEAEAAVLGSVLIDPSSLDTAATRLTSEDFYRRAHQIIYRAVITLYESSTEVDLITLTDLLESKNDLNKVGGAAYLSSLSSQVPSSANIEFYIEIVHNDSLRRQLIASSRRNSELAFDTAKELPTILEEAERRIFDIAENRQSLNFYTIQHLVHDAVNMIEQRRKQKGYSGIPSGFHQLDDLLSGFQDSEFIVLGARPSVGKTALALSMAVNIAIKSKIATGFFTLEMSELALVQRILSAEAGVSGQHMRSGVMKSSEYEDIISAANTIYDAPLWIADASGRMSLLDLRAQARRMCSKCGVKIIFIDYISLIASDTPDLPRHEQIAEISRSLKSLARELQIPIVALSQLTRDSEGKRPLLANIRESGSIEQDADVVMFLYRERNSEQNVGDEIPDLLKAELIVAKQRNGPVGTIEIGFIPRLAKFVVYDHHAPSF